MAVFTFDAWKGKTPKQLKDDCRRLNRALHNWQMIAMTLASNSPAVIEKLSSKDREAVKKLIAAYQD